MGDMPASPLRWYFCLCLVYRMDEKLKLEMKYLTEDERKLLEQLRKFFDN